MKEQDEIEQLFKSTFEDFSAVPPASVKDAVDLSIARKKAWSFRSFQIILSVSGLIVIGVVAAIWMNRTPQQKTHLTSTEYNPTETHLDVAEAEIEYNSTETDLNVMETGDNQQKANPSESVSNTNSSPQTETAKEVSRISNAKQANGAISSEFGSSVPANNDPPSKSKRMAKNPSKNKEVGKTRKNDNPSKNIQTASNLPVHSRKPGKQKNAASQKTKEEESQKSRNTSFIDPEETKIAQLVQLGGNNPAENTTPSNARNTPSPVKNETLAKVDSLSGSGKTASDSIAAVQVKDSITNDPKKVNRSNAFLFSMRAGSTLGFNRTKATDISYQFKLKEKNAVFIEGEAAWFMTPRLAIASGFRYQSWTENATKNYQITGDSVLNGYTPQYVYQDTVIIDTIYVPNYEFPVTQVSKQNSYKLYAISLPVMFMYSLELSPKLNLDLSAGGVFSVQGRRTMTENFDLGSSTVNSFGVKACVRTQLRYQFSQWGVSLNTNFGYDLIPVNARGGIQRTRTYLDFGIGLHYQIGK